MYQLIAKEINGTQTWIHVLGESIPNIPMSFNVDRENLAVSLFLLPPSELKEFFKRIICSSSKNRLSFEIKKVEIGGSINESLHQTVAIFKGMDVVPEANRLLVLHMVTGDVVSPVKRKACNHYHTPAGIVKEYMIKEWAYQDELNKALGLTALDPEKLEELEKRAEADDVDPRFTPQKIFDTLADVLSEIFPEAKVHVRKS
ncbi:hypothetical protein KTH52_12550 [Acinetobacter baumannii]|nr:hypothetical protein [Acinetobacter baumannii]